MNTLVLVHRQQLMEQWVERLSTFLGVPAKAIGRIGGGRKKPGGMLDVALVQSLVRKGEVNDLVGKYGHLVVDECHHLPAKVPIRAKYSRQVATRHSASITSADAVASSMRIFQSYSDAFAFDVPAQRETNGFAPFFVRVGQGGKQMIVPVEHLWHPPG